MAMTKLDFALKRGRLVTVRNGGKLMPVYEFECPKGTVTERLVSIGTESISCPCCEKKARKILSRFSFELKGGGWYADGYASTRGGGSPDKS
jgi:putative FmdB family regulatory protein